jgi:hypothetical protein
VQGIEAAQVVVKSEPWRVLDEVLVYLYDAKGWPLLPHCLCCRARGEADGTNRLDEADTADVPAFCCLHLGADKITAGLRHITLDQCTASRRRLSVRRPAR